MEQKIEESQFLAEESSIKKLYVNEKGFFTVEITPLSAEEAWDWRYIAGPEFFAKIMKMCPGFKPPE